MGFTVLVFAFAMHEAGANPSHVRSYPTLTFPNTPLTSSLKSLFLVVHYQGANATVYGDLSEMLPDGAVHASFQWIGHALACLFSGLIGSAIALFMEARSKRDDGQKA